MLDDRRDLLREVGWHLLAATPFLAATWYLFSSTSGAEDKWLLGLACGVAAGIIIARPIATLIAEPTGSLFFPRATAHPEPGYSLADTQRKRGQYERAMQEYEKIATQFPAELRAHIAMIEIAIGHLHDLERARAVAKRGLAMLPDETQRMELLRALKACEAAVKASEEAIKRELLG